jgi:hypothetical protein
MWAHGIVRAPPAFDDDIRRGEGLEDFPIEQFVA